MLFFGKMGFAKSQLAQIILFLVVAMAVIGPVININNFAYAATDVEKCRLSVIMASTKVGWGGIHVWDMELFPWDAPNPFYIDCPKRYAYVSNDNIKVDRVNTKLETDNEKERERQLKDFILGEMTKCWKSFGAASDTIYSAKAGIGEGSIDDVYGTACFSCSEVFFKDDFKAATIGDADFYEYANGKSMLIDGKGYVEFLTGGNAPPELPKVFGKEDKITLEKNSQWSTVFTIKKISLGFFGDKWNWVPLIDDLNVPPVNGGIVDCSVVKDGKFVDIDKRLTYAIGCKATEPPTIKGFVFGKVAKGINRLDINFLNDAGLLIDKETVRYPMTVRFIPTENVFGEGKEKCKRLY